MQRPKAIVLLLCWLICGSTVLGLNYFYWKLDAKGIQQWLDGLGIWGPVLYMFAYTVRPLVLFPASILSLAGGYVFDPFWGTVWTVLGASAGAMISFGAARWFHRALRADTANHNGEAHVARTPKWEALQQGFHRHGLLYVLAMRLIPLFPFDVVSYGAGVSRVSISSFAIGTVFGIIPGTFAYIFLGSSLGTQQGDKIAIAVGVFVIAIAIPLLAKRFFFREKS